MADYIKREDAINAAIDGADEWGGDSSTFREECIENEINMIPAADVRENVRGEWTGKDKVCEQVIRRCSACRNDAAVGRYCMWCGAKMDEGETDG